jgi:hypothetical protein
MKRPDTGETECVSPIPLSPGENVIRELRGNSVDVGRGVFVLTDRRVTKIVRNLAGSEKASTSFNLENLDSVHVRSSSPVGCLVMGTILGIAGVAAWAWQAGRDYTQVYPKWALIGGISVSMIGLLVFVLGRRKRIVLSSGRTDVELKARPPFFEHVQQLVQDIQDAKQHRLERLGRDQRVREPQSQKPVEERLRDVDDLWQRGVISEEERNAKRGRILDQI